jgi:nitrogen fixation-related uncharacterized protein
MNIVINVVVIIIVVIVVVVVVMFYADLEKKFNDAYRARFVVLSIRNEKKVRCVAKEKKKI